MDRPSTTVRRQNKQIVIPATLHEALGKPDALRAVKNQGGLYELMAVPKLGLRGKVKRMLGQSGPWIAINPKPTKDSVTYRVFEGEGAEGLAGEYRVANFHPMYCLMPAGADDPAAKNHEKFWAAISHYHEHRDPGAQMDWAQRRSEWVAGVLLATGAKRILEVGCGAGRNLVALRKQAPQADLFGIEINRQAAEKAMEATGPGRVTVGSLWDKANWPTEKFDVVFTSGVLSHLPHDQVGEVVRRMHAICTGTVFHFELHGPSHDFDYHRYPRDYGELYKSLGDYPNHTYEVFPEGDQRWPGLGMFRFAQITSPVKG